MKKLFPIILALLGIFSCSTSENENSIEQPLFEGSLEDIEEFYNPELVNALKDLGFVFNLGNNPPNIEGKYKIAPFIIQASNVEGDSIGKRFSDQIITLSNQNNEQLTIDFEIEGGNQTSTGKGSFLSGENSNFSIFVKTNTQNENSIIVETATSITGRIIDNDILDFQFAGLMLDDKGDPDEIYITNNTGRVFYDSDRFSPIEALAGKRFLKSNLNPPF